MGDGKTDHGAVREVNGTLHKTLTKGTPPHDNTTVLILYGTRDDFCGRGGIAVYQHNDLSIHESATAVGGVVHTRCPAAVSIDNEVTPLQELVGNVYSSLQITTSVLLKVEDQVLHTLLLQTGETLQEFLMGSGTEVSYTDEANARTNHIDGIDGMDRNLVAANGERQLVGNALTHDTQFHDSAFRSTQTLHNLFLRHLDASDGGIVDRHDTVACNDTYTFGGTIGYRLDDKQCVFHHIKLHTDALEITVQRLIQFRHLLRCGIR